MGILDLPFLSGFYVHFVGQLVVASIYLLTFLTVLLEMIKKQSSRNYLVFSIDALFLLVSCGLFFQALFAPEWSQPNLELIWLGVCLLPPVLFLSLGFKRRAAFLMTEDSIISSTRRFDKLKHEFLSVASHELRTPLSVINGFAEILLREKLGPLNDEQKRRVRKILLQGQRLNHIIDELLDLSRIRSGKIEVREEVFDIIPVLKACIDDHHIVCEQQHITLRDELPDLLPDVVGDLERVTQVVVNLLNNAIKYTEGGGTVTITAGHDKKKKGRIRVEVKDTGIGIDKEDQHRIFEEFYRASSKHQKKYSGSGLGLTIVKQLVESQGGEVGVESEGLGKGSCFYFTLPVAPNSKSKASFSSLRSL